MCMFKYNCPDCDEELEGDFGEDVYCKLCNKTFGTDWDYAREDHIYNWITGFKHEGKPEE